MDDIYADGAAPERLGGRYVLMGRGRQKGE